MLFIKIIFRFIKTHITGFIISVLASIVAAFIFQYFYFDKSQEESLQTSQIKSSIINDAKSVADSIVISGWERSGDYLGYISQITGFYRRHQQQYKTEYLFYSSELIRAQELIKLRSDQRGSISLDEERHLRGLVQSGEDHLEHIISEN